MWYLLANANGLEPTQPLLLGDTIIAVAGVRHLNRF